MNNHVLQVLSLFVVAGLVGGALYGAVARAENPSTATSSEVSKAKATECRHLDARITNNDAVALAGGTVPYMDNLRERRRKLVDRRYELRC